jgi:hypothetical protein
VALPWDLDSQPEDGHNLTSTEQTERTIMSLPPASESDTSMPRPLFASRIDYELYVAALILADVNQNPNYPLVDHAQQLAQQLADAFETRGYFSATDPLNRFEATAIEQSPSAATVVGGVGGHSKVEFVRGPRQNINARA